MYWWRRGAYRVLVGRSEGKIPLGRPRRRWEDNIKTDPQELDWGSWTELVWLRTRRDGGLCKRGNGPSGTIKFREYFV